MNNLWSTNVEECALWGLGIQPSAPVVFGLCQNIVSKKYMNEWMDEWMNEWMNEWLT